MRGATTWARQGTGPTHKTVKERKKRGAEEEEEEEEEEEGDEEMRWRRRGEVEQVGKKGH